MAAPGAARRGRPRTVQRVLLHRMILEHLAPPEGLGGVRQLAPRELARLLAELIQPGAPALAVDVGV